MARWLPAVTLAAALLGQSHEIPAGAPSRPLWNGTDFAGWHGQRHFDPYQLAAMTEAQRRRLRAEDDATMRAHWRVQDGELVNDGDGAYLTTDDSFGDAEFALEYRTVAGADSGVYLRGCPQVQIWDTTEKGGKWHLGADKGSGGLWNNERHPRLPLLHADRPFGEWNHLRIVMLGERVWVWLNEKLTVDGVVMENYWDRKRPLPPRGPLQLQTHGGEIRFRNLTVREFTPGEANAMLAQQDAARFAPIFDGSTLQGWQGALDGYEVVDGTIRCRPGSYGVLFTQRRYGDFAVRLQFRLPPGGNNGLAIRYPGTGVPSSTGCEVQVLDDGAEQYAALEPWQYHGSVYGVVPAHRGYLRPVGEWNFQEVVVRGTHYRVVLNGTAIVDADISDLPSALGSHPGKNNREGHFGFCGHGDPVEFRDLRVAELADQGGR